MNNKEIGKFIYDLRNEKGWTQDELAELIPITRQAVSRWERGKSIPDSSTLVILSRIFEVSINELLSGRRIPKKEIVKESEKITLDIIDKNISIYKRYKKFIKIFIISILFLITCFLGYYFFATYNSVKVYSIGGKSKNFYLQDGLMIVTKQKLFFKLGDLEHSDKIKIDNVSLSFNKNNEEKLIYKNNNFDKLIIENYGYEEYFYFDDLEDILKGITMTIYYNDGESESMILDFLLVLSNNKFTFSKRDVDKENIYSNSYNELEDKISKFMIKNGIYEDNYYIYKVENKTFKYFDKISELHLIRKNDYCVESWILNFSNLRLAYNTNEVNKSFYKKILCINGCSGVEKELFDRFYSYVYQYIL